MITGDFADPRGLLSDLRQLKFDLAENLQGCDPRVDVQVTDYYNNSFFPDYVLSWPGDAPYRRYVYLKGDVNPHHLREDIAHADFHPSILIARGEVRASAGELDKLRHQLVDTGTLLLEEATLQALGTARNAGRVLRRGTGFYRARLTRV